MASTKELQETLARINHKIESLQLAFQRQTENLQKENHELRDIINNLIDQVKSPVQDLEVVVESTTEERNSQVEEENEAPEVVAEDENPPVFNRMLYMNAVFAYQREDYQTATRQFSDLAVEASDDITAGNVLYWMADCYFQLGQPSKALSVLMQLDLFKESDKLDDSMILQGLAFRQLGEEEKAVAAFAGVVELYPESEYYRLAQMEYNRSLK